MKPANFEYHEPATVDEALTLLTEIGADAKILAGGQSLIPVLNMRLARPAALIDLNRLSELAYIRQEAGHLCIGAMTRHRAVECSQLVAECCPLLAEAMSFIGHVQIRNRGTIGGSLAHADPAAELPAVMACLDAVFVLQSRRGRRAVAAKEFFLGYLMTVLEPDELLVEIQVPIAPAGTGAAFVEVARRSGDFALCGVAVQILLGEQQCLSDLRVGLTGVGPGPCSPDLADLLGQPLTDELLGEVARRAVAAADPDEDVNASADYRRYLTGVLTRRALDQAIERAVRKGEGA